MGRVLGGTTLNQVPQGRPRIAHSRQIGTGFGVGGRESRRDGRMMAKVLPSLWDSARFPANPVLKHRAIVGRAVGPFSQAGRCPALRHQRG
jgi:hypothetical protein